jgi:ribosomal protein S1
LVSLAGENAEEVIPIGESQVFLVTKISKRDAQPTVSRAPIEREVAWERVREQLRADVIVDSLILETTKGGYRVDMGGINSFLPSSQICPQYLIGEPVGKTVPVKLIDVDEN